MESATVLGVARPEEAPTVNAAKPRDDDLWPSRSVLLIKANSMMVGHRAIRHFHLFTRGAIGPSAHSLPPPRALTRDNRLQLLRPSARSLHRAPTPSPAITASHAAIDPPPFSAPSSN